MEPPYCYLNCIFIAYYPRTDGEAGGAGFKFVRVGKLRGPGTRKEVTTWMPGTRKEVTTWMPGTRKEVTTWTPDLMRASCALF